MSQEAAQQQDDDNMDDIVTTVSQDVATAYDLLESQSDEEKDENHDIDQKNSQQQDTDNQSGDENDDSTGDDTGHDDDGTGDDTTGDEDQSDDDAGNDAGDDNDSDASISVPEHWSDSDKEMFNNQTTEAREFLLRRHKEMEGYLTQQTQQNKERLNEYESISEIMAPFQESLKSEGISNSEAIRRWAVAENMLNTQPEHAIKALADAYKVDLVALVGSQSGSSDNTSYTNQGGEEDNNISNSPAFKQLQSDVQEMRQSAMTQAHNDAQQRVADFAKATDDGGNLKHPYFEELEADIAVLAAVKRSQGVSPENIDLHDLYEQAVWANKSTREKMQASQRQAEADARKAEDKKRADQKREKAEKAKKASSTVKPSTDVNASGGGKDNKNASVIQDARAAYEQLEQGDRV